MVYLRRLNFLTSCNVHVVRSLQLHFVISLFACFFVLFLNLFVVCFKIYFALSLCVFVCVFVNFHLFLFTFVCLCSRLFVCLFFLQ